MDETQKTWLELIEERIQEDIHEAVDAWKSGARLALGSSFDEAGVLMVELDFGDCGDEFPFEDRLRSSLADLLRAMIRIEAKGAFFEEWPAPDAKLLAVPLPAGYHVTANRDLKVAQDLLRIVLEYEEQPRTAPSKEGDGE